MACPLLYLTLGLLARSDAARADEAERRTFVLQDLAASAMKRGEPVAGPSFDAGFRESAAGRVILMMSAAFPPAPDVNRGALVREAMAADLQPSETLASYKDFKTRTKARFVSHYESAASTYRTAVLTSHRDAATTWNRFVDKVGFHVLIARSPRYRDAVNAELKKRFGSRADLLPSDWLVTDQRRFEATVEANIKKKAWREWAEASQSQLGAVISPDFRSGEAAYRSPLARRAIDRTLRSTFPRLDTRAVPNADAPTLQEWTRRGHPAFVRAAGDSLIAALADDQTEFTRGAFGCRGYLAALSGRVPVTALALSSAGLILHTSRCVMYLLSLWLGAALSYRRRLAAGLATAAVMLAVPELIPVGRDPAADALMTRLAARSALHATFARWTEKQQALLLPVGGVLHRRALGGRKFSRLYGRDYCTQARAPG